MASLKNALHLLTALSVVLLMNAGCAEKKKKLSYAEKVQIKTKHYSALSEEEKIKAVREFWWRIEFIENPSLEVQKTALEMSTIAIEYIEKPYPEVQIMAINMIMKDGSFNKALTKLIDTFTEEAQIVAIQHNVQIIKFIPYPSPRVQLEAVKLNPFVVKNFINATDEAKAEAIRRNPKVKKYLH